MLLRHDGAKPQPVARRRLEPRHPSAGYSMTARGGRTVATGELEPASARSFRLEVHLAVTVVRASDMGDVAGASAVVKSVVRLDLQPHRRPHPQVDGGGDDSFGVSP